MNEETLFAQALAIQTPSERKAFLDEQCGDRIELREDLEQLLLASDRAGQFLNHPPHELQNTVAGAEQETTDESDRPACSLPGLEPCDRPDRIGRLGSYEIIEIVGQGGMGIVLRAWDTKLHRIVAHQGALARTGGQPRGPQAVPARSPRRRGGHPRERGHDSRHRRRQPAAAIGDGIRRRARRSSRRLIASAPCPWKRSSASRCRPPKAWPPRTRKA